MKTFKKLTLRLFLAGIIVFPASLGAMGNTAAKTVLVSKEETDSKDKVQVNTVPTTNNGQIKSVESKIAQAELSQSSAAKTMLVSKEDVDGKNKNQVDTTTVNSITTLTTVSDPKNKLLMAVQAGNLSEVYSLLASKIFVDIRGEHGFTSLHLASRAGNVAIIEKLLDAGANIQAENKNANTPLHSAAYGNQPAAVSVLVKRGAKLDARNKDGDTPLHLAAWNNSIDAIKILLAKEADLYARNKDGETPIDLAKKRNNAASIDALSCAHCFFTSALKAQELAKRITARAEKLKSILSDYQTYDVTNYEIDRSVRTLMSLRENRMYLEVGNVLDSIAVVLPSNLPLYSLVVFALIPSFLSKNVNVRPNALLQEHNIVTRIFNELELDSLFPGVKIINTDHTGFKPYFQDANLIVFTGSPIHAEALLQYMKDGAILVINGSGHNPVVVTESANICQAVEGVLLVASFNGGQDCAGPDAILVHNKVAQEFIGQFNKVFSSIKTGKFSDPSTKLGPISRFSELQKFAQIFYENSKDILTGGIIDFKNNIVFPTTIVRNIERYPNYKEMFGPVVFIHPYKTDADLAYYFQDPDGQYNVNRMYVTVYGHSDYISSKDDAKKPGNPGNVGIVLHNQTIHDVEIGYKPYGGYSLRASCVIKKTSTAIQKVAMPILIPEIIFEYLIKGKSLPVGNEAQKEVKAVASVKRGRELDPIIKGFQDVAIDVFGSNIAFGFVFGSAAKGKLCTQGPDRDDLDTFICIRKDDKAAIEEYKKRLVVLHDKYSLKVDTTFPAEIMTLETLEKKVKSLNAISIDVDKLITGDEFDHIFWIHALTDNKKTGFIGDGKLMSGLIKLSLPYMYKWKDQILEQLQQATSLPSRLAQTFPGLTKQEVVGKLSQYNPHMIIHLGLNYDDEDKK